MANNLLKQLHILVDVSGAGAVKNKTTYHVSHDHILALHIKCVEVAE